MTNFTPLESLLGGVLIGLAATLMLAMLGRICGVSGIIGGLLAPARNDAGWRIAFVAGLLAGGAIALQIRPEALAMTLDRSPVALAVAGLAVGFGTRMGSGCTSGHGVCGLARGSVRSLTATLVFMASGVATVFVVGRLFGGSL